MANLCTDENFIQAVIGGCGKAKFREFMTLMISTLERKKLKESEEYILNTVSCATNLLFYDVPSSKEDDDMLNQTLRIKIFKTIKLYVLETTNEEL